MDISSISLDDVSVIAVRTLGLDAGSVAVDYPEAVAASLRRAASFLCPTTPRELVDAVLEVISPLISETLAREDVMDLVDQLVSTGDLLELTQSIDDRNTRLLYLGPPCFIEKFAGTYLLTGIRPFGAPLVGDEIAIDYEGHTRSVRIEASGAESRLRAAGLHKLSTSAWVGSPSRTTATNFVDLFRIRLSVARAAGFVDGLTIIDPDAKPNYYRGRWRPPAPGDTGDFVGRRPQAYGADLWCVVQLIDGAPKRLLDLPLDYAVVPARDDAWRLQAAIDAVNGKPLQYRLRALPAPEITSYVVDFFSPLPTWAERYLELVGSSMDKSRGSLFSYRVPDAAVEGLSSILTEALWMSITDQES